MNDGTGLAEKMLGLPGLVVLEVEEGMGELMVRVESTRPRAYCPSCRRRAEAQDRIEVHLRDLHCFGRPRRLVIAKRRWRCPTPATRTATGCGPGRCIWPRWPKKPGSTSPSRTTHQGLPSGTRSSTACSASSP